MPKISEFFGIKISIRFREGKHNLPHFHAEYAGKEISISIETLALLEGSIQRRALGMVMEWAALHQEELLAGWKEAQAGRIPKQIAPLE